MNARRTCSRAVATWLLVCAALTGCAADPHAEDPSTGPVGDEPGQHAGDDAAASGQPAATGARGQLAGGLRGASSAQVATEPAKDAREDDAPVATPDPTPVLSSDIERPLVLTPEALLPESAADFRRVRVHHDAPGTLTFEFAGSGGAALRTGSVIAGHGGGGYLRRVTEVSENPDGSLTVHTVEAALTELIAEGHFVLRAAALPPQPQAFQIGLPAGLPCTLEATGQVVQVTPSYDFTPELELEVDIGWDDDAQRPVLEYARAVVTGDLTLTTTLASQGTVHGRCEADLLGALQPVSWTTNFALGLLPVTVRHKLGPSLTVALDLLLEGGLTATASVTVSLTAGLEYTCGRWQNLAWGSEVSGAFDVEPTARGTLTGTLTPALGYDIELLGLASASVGVRSDLVGRVRADLVECSWDATLDASVTAYAHAQVDLPVVGPIVDIDEERVLWSDNLASDEGSLPFCS
jgi:hypothetical protein